MTIYIYLHVYIYIYIRARTPTPCRVLKVTPRPAQLQHGSGVVAAAGQRRTDEWSAPGQRNWQCAWPRRPVTIFRRPPPPLPLPHPVHVHQLVADWLCGLCLCVWRSTASPLSRLTIDLPGRCNASLCSRPSARVSLSPRAFRAIVLNAHGLRIAR